MLQVFTDILTLITTSSGGLAYYVVLLFSIWAMVGLALSRWSRRERRGITPNLLIAGGLMSFGRFLIFILALIDRQQNGYLASFGPPLERLVDAGSLLLIFWAFVISWRKQTITRVMVAAMGLVFLGFYVIAAMQWHTVWQENPALAYNLFWHLWVWEIGQLLFAIVALAYLFAVPIPERGTLIVSLSVLAAGHLLQAVLPYADQIPHFAGWVRFANLIAFPLLAVSAFRLIVHRFDAQAAELRAVSQESLSQVTGLMDLVDVNRKIVSSLRMDTVLQNAVRSVSQIVSTNLCALAFVNDGGMNEVEIVVIYDAHQINQTQTRFLAQDYPAIEYAITRGKAVILDPNENGRTTAIYKLLGYETAGPLMIQPLESAEAQSGAAGLVLVGRLGESRPFSAVEIHKCETLSRHISTALGNARLYRQLEEQHAQVSADLRLLEMEHTRTKANLENRLKQKEKEISLYIQKLYETELSEQRAHNDLREKLNRDKRAESELSQTTAELHKSISQVGILTQKISQLDATRIELERRIQTLEQQNADLDAQLSQANDDQSSLTALVQQLRQSLTEQKPRDEQTQAKDEFLNALAQELRTPMTSIVGYTELLLSGSVGELGNLPTKFLQRVQANIERMGGMLNDLVGVTAIDSGKLVIELENVDIARLIENALDQARFRLEEKELEPSLEIQELSTIHADPESLQQVLDNLLTNACKSSQVGTKIKLLARRETDDSGQAFLHIAVSDTGGGVAPQDRPRVFERFYRADDTLIDGLGETGVGLSIVKALVQAHDGRVWIESEMGVGSTFHFTIPFGLQEEQSREPSTTAVKGNGYG